MSGEVRAVDRRDFDRCSCGAGAGAVSAWRIEVGECVERFAEIEDASVDAIVTDPPYGIGFMGHEWDQPGEHAGVRANGTPGPFASGKPYPGAKVAGGQRRARNPAPSGYDRPVDAKRVGTRIRFGGPTGEKHTGGGGSHVAGGAMHAGRYDLSLEANRRFQAWCEEWAREAMRVLKPGGHVLASGSPRTYHRLAAGIEDAGFEIRDSLCWLFGSGFPKSRDVQAALDVQAAAIADAWLRGPYDSTAADARAEVLDNEIPELAAAIDDLDGWGTALKPGFEPIVVARKPLSGTIVETVLEHRTGALNIDGVRIPIDDQAYEANHSGDRGHAGTREPERRGATNMRMGGGGLGRQRPARRWPVAFQRRARRGGRAHG